MDTSNIHVPEDAQLAELLTERLFDDTLGALELFSVYLGAELGFYRVLHEQGPLTAAELAQRTGTAPRYVSEWLEQQAVAALVETDPGEPAGERRYRLPAAHARVLVDADDPAHVAPFAHMLAGIGGVIAEVAEAYRTGAGVPYESYGRAFRHGQGHINRPAFTHELPDAWLAAMPDIAARLREAPRSRVADVGCGQGWAALAIARAFPNVCVDGLDADASSVADARAAAERAGLGDRVRMEQADACRIVAAGPYDLVMILEVLHDLSRPVEALRSARAALAPGGAVLVVDERVSDRFTAPGDKVERMMYGWSVTHCLPAQLVEFPSAATGTVMRAGTVRRYAEEAGFARCSVLPVDNDFFRLYRLDP
ncbi:SAM-dependent methyltransferase [Nonomuraea rhodomycinica]|uniref:Methyltransferase domain-containing protein n=1 Tax=Nonomuraea rhodomycinica TaxID=1712872 RepID=A0A7Y6M9G4_9ACTN|nr:class I SAM-dependent methyltransferase [Nonomuraea rhodomycinica]NUW38750.1 methyltransferase domain-containing protein [Nonomuraea rhodomycinica]